MTEPTSAQQQPKIITLTEAAAARARVILDAAEGTVAGLWIGVGEGGG